MVKFSHSLQFNTVPDWASDYVAYSNLKKTLYAIEKYNAQATIEGGASRLSDIEQGHSGSVSSIFGSEKQSKLSLSFGSRGKGNREIAVAAAAQEASLHNGSDIFPPESAAFEYGLAKELAKIKSFYIRKERELSAELEAVDRQWQLEELKQKKERIAHGEEEDDSQPDSRDMERRISVDIDDEKQIGDVERSQLNGMMGWERDGLIDQDTIIDMKSAGHPGALTVNGSTVAGGSVQGQSNPATTSVPGTSIAFSDTDGSEYNPKSYGPQSSVGDLTAIVWRRECLIEAEDDESKAKKTSTSSRSHEDALHPYARHQSLDIKRQPSVESMGLKRSQSHHNRRISLNPKRSFSAMHENPNQRPSVYAPLTTEALLRRRLIDTYMLFSELKSYVALNYLGFRKIVKKHDKISGFTTLSRYMSEVVGLSGPFQAESRQHLDSQVLRIQTIYARTCANGSMVQAAKELRSHLREYIVWERNTIWRDMVGQERKAEGARAVDLEEQEP
ncbi:low-affinity phosphate transporter, partial [Modicella reniformis]